MAHKAKSFKLNQKKKNIVIYTNVDEPAEKQLIDYYLNAGYIPMFEEKKPSKTVKDMREELSKDDDALIAFEKAYKEKNGFFNACKIYSTWKKENKEKEKK